MSVFWTADFHLGHKNIIEYCNRPFDTVEEMDRAILQNLNEKVKSDDILYFLGDFCMASKQRTREYREAINCKEVYMVWGNHDKHWSEWMFKDCWEQKLISINGQKIFCNHYCMKSWRDSFHGSWHMFAHSHGTLRPDVGAMAMDVGVDCHNFYPVSFEEVKAQMNYLSQRGDP